MNLRLKYQKQKSSMKGAIILAGGRSTRCLKNKALLKLGDKPLIRHVVDKILKVADDVCVAIRRNSNIFEYTNILPAHIGVTKDTVASQSPLIGILTGMKALKSEYATVLPCDSPFIKAEVIRYLFKKTRDADAAIPKWPNNYIEPLHSVYKVNSAIRAAEEALKEGELSPRDMIKRLNR